MDLSPQLFWDMTPREFELKLEGYQEREAWKAILHGRAQREKRIPTMDRLLNRGGNVVSLEEHKKRFEEAVDLMGPDKIPVRPRKKVK